jgi:ABC-type antimicrobial peptide transport system permease subunit
VIKGRWFAVNEPGPVVVLNETLAKVMFGRDDPVGRQVEGFAIGEPTPERDPNPVAATAATVVGVVSDLRYTKLDEDPVPEYYIPYDKARSLYRMNLVVHTAGDPAAIVPAMRAALAEFDKNEKPFDVMTLEESLRDSIAPRRFNLVVLLTFAATSLLLALVGIYGVMSYSVSQRGHELGIRSALGAQRRDVVAMVVRQGMGVAFAGISVGLIAALLLTRTMGGLLYAVEPGDPLTFIAAAALLAVTAFAACVGPALKAALVNPLIALRCE